MTIAVQVENVSKYYRLGTIGGGTLRADIGRWWAELRGHPNPFRTISEHKQDLAKGNLWALREVSFELNQGGILGVIGRNGAGKSTLLKILSRITAPTSGEVRIRGRTGSLLEVGTGFHQELTGRENIFLNGAILGMGKVEITRKLDEIIEFSGIAAFIDTPVKRYSSGMTVRLAFAVAAHLDPEILIVDEVLAVGDAEFQRRCLGKMSDVVKGGRTVLFVSHNMAAIRHLCPYAILLDDGQIVCSGKSAEVTNRYYATVAAGSNASSNLPFGYLFRVPQHSENESCAIVSLQSLDLHERPIGIVRTWDYVRFRMTISSAVVVDRGSVVLIVKNMEGATLSRFSTQPDSNVPLRISQGIGHVDLVVPRWPFAEGRYQISLGVAIPGTEYIWFGENVCSLDTYEQDVFGSGRAPSASQYSIAVEHYWVLPPEIPSTDKECE